MSLAYSALVYDWNYAEAEKEFKQSHRLRPGYATAHQYYAYYLTAMGDLNQAIAERKRPFRSSPSHRCSTLRWERHTIMRDSSTTVSSQTRRLSPLTRTMPLQ